MVMLKNDDIRKDQAELLLAYLTLNCSFNNDLGLFYGKMGHVIFFAHLSCYCKNEFYDHFAEDLLEDIYNDINKELSIDLESGLCGIGWGIEYLIQNNFLEGNSNLILKDIDRRIMEFDMRRITDFSFERGLAGIVYYVLARLSGTSGLNSFPFESLFLNNLKEAIVNAEGISPFLCQSYMSALDGIMPEKHKLMDIIGNMPLVFYEKISDYSLGLRGGISGILFSLMSCNYNVKPKFCHDNSDIFIFVENSRAATYGIGTYIGCLVDVVNYLNLKVTVVCLRSKKTETILVEYLNGIRYIYISSAKGLEVECDEQNLTERYYRSVTQLLIPFVGSIEKPIFHLNYMHMDNLALLLKKTFYGAKIILTVHYTSWSLDLLGNKKKLLEVLMGAEDENSKRIYQEINREKRLLNSCDYLIAISKHSYDDLKNIHKISAEKITLISHGIRDYYIPISERKKRNLREKYGFSSTDKILVYAGRIDPVKGVTILTKAFAMLLKESFQLHLVIIGDGCYDDVLSNLKPYWSRVTLTGFVDKSILHEFFLISDIGVLPSLHEEFGYVALEMMMMELALIVGRTTGLYEITDNGRVGISVELNDALDDDSNARRLKESIMFLLNKPLLRKKIANEGRLWFKHRYDFSVFGKNMELFYNKVKNN